MSAEVYHEVSGSADDPLVLLVNSLGTDTRMWEPLLGPLVAAGFRVLRYDSRGHGRSPVPAAPYTMDDLGTDAVALLDRLGVERAHVVGASLGGMVAMWLGQHAPERVDRLVLCCTSAELGPATMWDDRVTKVREAGMAAVAAAVTDRWLTPRTRERDPELARWLRDMLAATPPEGYVGCSLAIRDMDLVTGLGSISAPTLVISGGADPATPQEHGQRITDAIPGAEHVVVPDVAHLGLLEQPARFIELIVGHLNRTAA